MSNETNHPPSLPHAMLQMIQAALTGSMSFDTLIHILSLMCLLSIVQRMPPGSAAAPPPVSASGGNTTGGDALQKLLGQLAKSESGGSGDTLSSLLPLLSSPQLKSKMTPANIATILGLLNTMNAVSGDNKSDKSEKDKDKDGKKDSPAATVTTELPSASIAQPAAPAESVSEPPNPATEKQRYLEWKTNF